MNLRFLKEVFEPLEIEIWNALLKIRFTLMNIDCSLMKGKRCNLLVLPSFHHGLNSVFHILSLLYLYNCFFFLLYIPRLSLLKHQVVPTQVRRVSDRLFCTWMIVAPKMVLEILKVWLVRTSTLSDSSNTRKCSSDKCFYKVRWIRVSERYTF